MKAWRGQSAVLASGVAFLLGLGLYHWASRAEAAFIAQLNPGTYTLQVTSSSANSVAITASVINRRNDRVVEIQTLQIAPSAQGVITAKLPLPGRWIIEIDPPEGGSVHLQLYEGEGTTGTTVIPGRFLTGDTRWVFDI